ncbi:DUF6887 family protein [Acaryochloris sp. CCMEE 5410]|uniref:DUF6887 family protein n=1 Tax=Acaryochloris sp. CCMEE 5410 TaxID=310037 RepID=UPI0002483F06|nr:hypothetical protein [Acaryochloris sp. CCMEE 5410]KAI9133030.1 hypothetical protein ON05_006600 [Acaryochloris sp. CCMEE 5410]
MTQANFDKMNLDKLRQYVLAHREDINAFQVYVDRSKASGRMITINPGDPNWEDALEQKIQQITSGEAESN